MSPLTLWLIYMFSGIFTSMSAGSGIILVGISAFTSVVFFTTGLAGSGFGVVLFTTPACGNNFTNLRYSELNCSFFSSSRTFCGSKSASFVAAGSNSSGASNWICASCLLIKANSLPSMSFLPVAPEISSTCS